MTSPTGWEELPLSPFSPAWEDRRTCLPFGLCQELDRR